MKTLTIMELSTLVSAFGTLALAITSVYQMRRTRKDSLHPMLYADSIWLEADPADRGLNLQRIFVHLRNYGTGPALDIQFTVRVQHPESFPGAGHTPLPIQQIVRSGQAIEYMNMASSQEAQIELLLEPGVAQSLPSGCPLTIEVGYRSVYKERMKRTFSLHSGAGHAPIEEVAGSI